MNKDNLPKKLPVFPLSNFIIFPKTTVPLNIFETRYVEMINDSMKSNKFIGMIQPRVLNNKNDFTPELYQVGCMGKITSFKETEDGRYLIDLKGIIRFRILEEINSDKKYRECKIDFQNFYEDLENKKEELKFSDLELIFKDLKTLLLYIQSLYVTIYVLAMASPFTLEEKQVLLEAKDLKIRKTKIAEILTTYTFDQFNNTTIQ